MPRSASIPPSSIPLRLRHWRDWQSLLYLAILPLIMLWQWQHGWVWWLYAVELFLTLGVGVIHHNHTHLRMWRGRHSRWANRATDYWLTLLQGHPTFVFWPAHVGNHHRYRHSEQDIARTYRFGGDTNHLWGYLAHPVQAAWVLYPLFIRWLGNLRCHWPGAFRYCMGQYALWLGSWAALLLIDWKKALILVIIPQLHGLHWLLATNYLQHAHADGRRLSRAQRDTEGSMLNYARNFEGLVNPLLFNIGLHTAHHECPHVHWSELTGLHDRIYRRRVDPALNEGGLLPYMARVFLGGLVWRPARSRSLMPPMEKK